MFEKMIKTENLYLCLIVRITKKEFSGLYCDFKFEKCFYRICRKKEGIFYNSYVDVLNKSTYKSWQDGNECENVVYSCKILPFNNTKVKISDIINYVNISNSTTKETSDDLEK